MKKFISLKEEHIIDKIVSLFNQQAKVKARLLKRLLEVDSTQLDVIARLKTLGMLTEDTLKSVSLIQSQPEKKRQREEATPIERINLEGCKAQNFNFLSRWHDVMNINLRDTNLIAFT